MPDTSDKGCKTPCQSPFLADCTRHCQRGEHSENCKVSQNVCTRFCYRHMHPPLHLDKHKHCQQQILALQLCHRDHKLAKFWGVCNQPKWDLDRCLREEKSINRKANFHKAREEQERFRQRDQTRPAAPASTR